MQQIAIQGWNMQKTARTRQRGQNHPRANLTDREVELMRQLHEDPDHPWGYKRLAAKFEVPKRTVRDICNYRYRYQGAVAGHPDD